MSEWQAQAELFSSLSAVRCRNNLDTPAPLLNILSHSGRNQNIHPFKTVMGEPIGYVAWICVNRESFLMTSKTKTLPPYAYEWNEGKLVIIYDVVFSDGWNEIAKEMLMDFIKRQRLVGYLKRGRFNVIYRQQGKLKKVIF